MIRETTFQATARFENGEPSIKVTAFTPYGKRTASVSAEVTDKKLLKALAEVLNGAIETAREDLQRQSFSAAAEAARIAAINKEAF
jgi:hypothetical protein